MANVTRIKNNQITDSTITYQKIVPGTLVGSLFNSNLTLNSNVSIIGNLTVAGYSSSVSSTNTYVNDPLVVFNNGYTGSLSGYDIGILINRNLSSLAGYSGGLNTAWIWSEADSAFVAIVTTDSGGGVTNLNNSGYANIRLGNLTAVSAAISGNLVATSFNGTFYGDIYGTNGVITNLSSSNVLITGGALSGVNGAFTTLTATNFSTGNAQITGGDISVSGGVITTLRATNFGTANAQITGGNVAVAGGTFTTLTATNFSTANAQITGGDISGVDAQIDTGVVTNFSTGNAKITGGDAAFTTLTATNFSTANAQITGGDISGVDAQIDTGVVTNFSTANAQVTGGNGAFTTLTATNFSTANAQITGGDISGVDAQIDTGVVTNLSSGNARITGGYADNFPIGANTAATGKFTNVTDTALTNSRVVIAGAGGLLVDDSTLTYASGILSASNLYTNGNATATNGYITNLATTTGVVTNFSTGNAQITGGDISGVDAQIDTGVVTNLSSGNLNVTGGNGAFTTLTATNFSTANARITGGDISGVDAQIDTGVVTNFSTANAQITGGDISGVDAQIDTGVVTNLSSGNARINGGAVNSTPIGATTANTGAFTSLSASGPMYVSGTDAATTSNIGALVVAGGIAVNKTSMFGQDVIIAGNLTVNGDLTTLNTATLDVEDLNITVAKGAASSAAADGAGLTVAGAAATLLYVDATTSWNVNKRFYAPSARITDATASVDTTTGALVVTGGVGIGGNLNVGGEMNTGPLTATTINNTPIGDITPSTGNFTNLHATNFSTANAVITGGSINSTPIGNSTPSTGSFTTLHSYSMTVDGDASVGGNLNVTNNVNITSGNIITSNAGSFIGNAITGFGALYAGIPSGYSILPQLVFQVSANYDGYAQINTQNINNGNFASSDFVATADNGDDSSYFVDLGIASSTYNYPLFSAIRPNDSYLLSNGGNLLLNAGSVNKVVYVAVGGSDLEHIVATFNHANTASSSASTGALVIEGGIGVSANSTIGGNLVVSGGRASTSTTTGAVVVTGGLGVSGAINAGSINATLVSSDVNATNIYTTNFSTGNALITGGSLSGISAASITTLYATNFSTGNAQISGGNAAVSTLTTTNFSTGNAQITGGGVTGVNGSATTFVITNFSTGNAKITGGDISGVNAQINTGVVTNFSSGNLNVTGGNAAFTTLTATNFSTGNAQITGGAVSNVNAQINTGVVTNFSTANARITGGYIDGTPIGDTTTSTGKFTTLSASGLVYVSNADEAITSNIGSVVLAGGLAVNKQVQVGGNLVATSTTDSTNVTTGSFVSKGGAGFASNVFVGKGVTVNSTNNAGGDLRVRGVNTDTLIWARPNSTYDQVLIGNTATSGTLVPGAKLQINSTDSILLPVGTNAQRPSGVGQSDVTGMLRFSTTSNAIEWYTGTQWENASTTFTVIVDQQFNGDDSTVNFTLSQAATTNSIIVSINGVVQIPTLAYAVGGGGNTTLTFTEAPASGDIIDVRILTTTQSVTGLASANGYMQVTMNNSGIDLSTGSGSSTVTTSWEPGGAEVSKIAAVTIATSGVATTIDSFSKTTYRTAKYILQASISGSYHAQEVLVVHDGSTATAIIGTAAVTGSSLGTPSVTISGSNVLLQFNANNNNTDVRIKKEYIVV